MLCSSNTNSLREYAFLRSIPTKRLNKVTAALENYFLSSKYFSVNPVEMWTERTIVSTSSTRMVQIFVLLFNYSHFDFYIDSCFYLDRQFEKMKMFFFCWKTGCLLTDFGHWTLFPLNSNCPSLKFMLNKNVPSEVSPKSKM